MKYGVKWLQKEEKESKKVASMTITNQCLLCIIINTERKGGNNMGEIIQEYGKVILGVIAVIALCGILYFVGTKISDGTTKQINDLNTKTTMSIPTPNPS